MKFSLASAVCDDRKHAQDSDDLQSVTVTFSPLPKLILSTSFDARDQIYWSSSLAFATAVKAGSGYSMPSTSAASAVSLNAGCPIHASTNPASFHSLLSMHRAMVVMFTSAMCPAPAV